MLWMVLLGGRSRSEEDVVGDPRIRNSSHSAAHLLSRVLGAKVGVREPPLGRFILSRGTVCRLPTLVPSLVPTYILGLARTGQKVWLVQGWDQPRPKA